MHRLRRPVLRVMLEISDMKDPLDAFDWPRLYERYDALCTKFDPSATQLKALTPRPHSDRDLYYRLIDSVRTSPTGKPTLSIHLYGALLYWKLYSQHTAVGNLRRWLAPEALSTEADNLARLLQDLPGDLRRDEMEVVSLVRQLGIYKLVGTKTETALPVRTTLLHFLFPDVIPIFDKMVLQAVGVRQSGANQRISVLQQYLPFAWKLADLHCAAYPHEHRETPIRLIDMALWVVRDS